MNRINFSKFTDFLKNINLNDFPLVNHYINYDNCYMDDNWIQYSIFYEDKIPVCVVAKRLPDEQIGHILILEVNKNLRNQGYGKKMFNMYMKDKPYWELFSLKESEDFYKKLGFKKDRFNEMFYYGYDKY